MTPDATSNSKGFDRIARLAGLLYLCTIISGLFAEIAVRGHMRSHSAARTAENIFGQQDWYRLGEAADLIMLCCYIAVTALLYRIFAPAARSLALVAAGFSMVGIAVLAVGGVLHLAPLAIMGQSALAQPNELVWLVLNLYSSLYTISLVFFGMYCVLTGWLCITSRLLPVSVGLLMIVGGLVHVITRFLWIAAPAIQKAIPGPINMLPLLGETALAVWLLLFGIRDMRTQNGQRANATGDDLQPEAR